MYTAYIYICILYIYIFFIYIYIYTIYIYQTDSFPSHAGRLLTLEDDGGRCRATGDDEVMQVSSGWKADTDTCLRAYFSGQITTTSGLGHLKWWWFSKGIPPVSALNSGLGILLICPDFWSNYSDLTRPTWPPKGSFLEGKLPNISGKSRGWWKHIIWPDEWWICSLNVDNIFVYIRMDSSSG